MRYAKTMQEIGTIAFAGEPDIRRHGEVRKQTVVLRLVADSATFRTQSHPSCGVEPNLSAKGDTSLMGPLQSRDAPQQ
jgi:hypothetical protein